MAGLWLCESLLFLRCHKLANRLSFKKQAMRDKLVALALTDHYVGGFLGENGDMRLVWMIERQKSPASRI